MKTPWVGVSLALSVSTLVWSATESVKEGIRKGAIYNLSGSPHAGIYLPKKGYVIAGCFTLSDSRDFQDSPLILVSETGEVDLDFSRRAREALTKTIPGFKCNSPVHTLAKTRDGILFSGSRYLGGSQHRGHLIKLKWDGSLDETFPPQPDLGDASIFVIRADAKDRLYVGGNFKQLQGQEVGSLARLDAQGKLDPTWPIGKGFDDSYRANVRDIDFLPNERAVVVGSFWQFKGKRDRTLGSGVALIDAQGNADLDFGANTWKAPGFSNSVERVGVQVGPNGNLTVVTEIGEIYRFTEKGALAAKSDAAKTNPDWTHYAKPLFLKDGSIVLRSLDFPRTRLLHRLLPDGTLDAAFSEQFSREISAVTPDALHNQGEIVLGTESILLVGYRPIHRSASAFPLLPVGLDGKVKVPDYNALQKATELTPELKKFYVDLDRAIQAKDEAALARLVDSENVSFASCKRVENELVYEKSWPKLREHFRIRDPRSPVWTELKKLSVYRLNLTSWNDTGDGGWSIHADRSLLRLSQHPTSGWRIQEFGVEWKCPSPTGE